MAAGSGAVGRAFLGGILDLSHGLLGFRTANWLLPQFWADVAGTQDGIILGQAGDIHAAIRVSSAASHHAMVSVIRCCS